jgi:anaerobic selenocysteine-containing dehydrogenase
MSAKRHTKVDLPVRKPVVAFEFELCEPLVLGASALHDFALTEAIFLIGGKPVTQDPGLMTVLRHAFRRGVPILAVDLSSNHPLRQSDVARNTVEMTPPRPALIASEYIQVRHGGDGALLRGIMKALLEAHARAKREALPPVLDEAFINHRTAGFEALAEDLRWTRWTDILRASGVERERIEHMAAVYMRANATIVICRVDGPQHRHDAERLQQVTNLLLMRGNVGRPGAGIFLAPGRRSNEHRSRVLAR